MENIYGAFEQPCMAGWELRMCATEETLAKIPDGEDGLRLYDDCSDDDEQGPSTKETVETNSLKVSSKKADDDNVEASSQDNDGNTTPTDHDPS